MMDEQPIGNNEPEFTNNKNPLGIGTENGDLMHKELVFDQLNRYEKVLGPQVVRLLTDRLPERTNGTSLIDPKNPGNFIVQEAGVGWSRVYEKIGQSREIIYDENVTKESVNIKIKKNTSSGEAKIYISCSVNRAVMGGEDRCLVPTIIGSNFLEEAGRSGELTRIVTVTTNGEVSELLVANSTRPDGGIKRVTRDKDGDVVVTEIVNGRPGKGVIKGNDILKKTLEEFDKD